MNNKKYNHKSKKKIYTNSENDEFQYCAKRKTFSFKSARKFKNKENDQWDDY